MGKEVVKFNKVSKRFGGKEALQNVHLTINQGEILGLVGANGAGKTTMIKILMGLLHPSTGSVQIFGKDRGSLTQEELAQIGFVPDEFNLYEWMTVDQIIHFQQGFYPRWDNVKCEGYLDRFMVPRKDKIRNLSKGTKSQVALILALCTQPKLLVLDEPLEGLDPTRRLDFLGLVLEEFLEEPERSILISSHYLEELERMADRVAFLSEGIVQHLAPMEQIKAESKTIRVVFQKDPPAELLQMQGITEVKREGKLGYLIKVEEHYTEIYNACAGWPHFVLETYHRSLEDLFMDYSGSGDYNA